MKELRVSVMVQTYWVEAGEASYSNSRNHDLVMTSPRFLCYWPFCSWNSGLVMRSFDVFYMLLP